MQAIVVPDGNAYMTGIQPFPAGEHGQDVTVFDAPPEERRVANAVFRYVGIFSAGQLDFHFSDGGDDLRLAFHHRVILRMGRHVVQVKHLFGRERRVKLFNMPDVAHAHVVFYPG